MLPLRLAHPTAAFGALGVRLLPALAAMAAIGAFGTFSAGVPGSAESVYLAFAAGVVLLATAAVALRPGVEVAAGAVLVTVAAWALPEGPARGGVVMALAAGALAVAAARRLGRTSPLAVSPVVGVGLALGCQALLRGGELLHAGSALRAAVVFVAFPVAGALAVLVLAREHGGGPALLAAAAAILVAPGFRPASVAALVALAAAPWLFRRSLPGSIVAAALLLAPAAWDPRAATVSLAAGVVGVLGVSGVRESEYSRRRAWLALLAALVALAAVVGLALADQGELVNEIPSASLVALAVPALLLRLHDLAPGVLSVLALALAGVVVTVEGGLAAPAALAMLVALDRPRRPDEDASGRSREREARYFWQSRHTVQAVWTGAALTLACILGSYPWLRAEPFRAALSLVGVEVDGGSALLLVLASTLVLGAVAYLALRVGDLNARMSSDIDRRDARPRSIVAWTAGAVLFALLWFQAPGGATVSLGGSERGERAAVVLEAGRPVWSGASGIGPVRSVVIDSSLANAAALPVGTPVASVRLRHAGVEEEVWSLRAGVETGEWAAGRPDVLATEAARLPAWLSWVAEGGDFFGRRYRTVLPVVPAAPDDEPGHLTVELRDDLPEGVTLTLFHVGTRP